MDLFLSSKMDKKDVYRFDGLWCLSQVTQFLLDKTLVMDEDTLYELSLKIEPRIPPAWDHTTDVTLFARGKKTWKKTED